MHVCLYGVNLKLEGYRLHIENNLPTCVFILEMEGVYVLGVVGKFQVVYWRKVHPLQGHHFG